MIELAIGAGLVALTIVALRAMRKRGDAEEEGRRAEDAEQTAATERRDDDTGEPAGDDAEEEPVPRSPRPDRPRGLRVDDVLLFADDEMWLAGEIYLDEEGFALALFPTPGSPRSEWVAQLDLEGKQVALLSPTEEVSGGVVPTEVPVGGMRLSLRRRGHADAFTTGDHLPPTTERARYCLLGGPGGRVLVVVDFDGGDRLALLGESVRREMLDLLPGGG